MPRNVDLFGREIFEPINGDTLPMFHEPVLARLPQRPAIDRRIAAQYADIESTAEIFADVEPAELQ